MTTGTSENAAETMVSVRDLGVSFDGRAVLSGINLELGMGETLVVLGKNGSGKSVLLKAIAGLIDSWSGAIEVRGEETGRVRLAYVFQKGGLFDSMNVFDNVAFGLRRIGLPGEQIAAKVTAALQRVGLAGSEGKLPSELSGGMQKRVGLARAICLDPQLILYDDPTAGLDPILSDSIADLILEIRDAYRTTSLVVTQDLKVARKIAGSIALLYEGRFVFQGTGEAFFSEENTYARQFVEGDIEGPIDIF